MEPVGTVLIVDDEPSVRTTMEALLVKEGYKLVFASNGPEALTQANIVMPDLILLDVMMPGMDGYEVCRRLRATPLLAEVPIILVTALDDREARLEGLESGADDFVTKPFDRIELRTRIRTVIRLNRYRHLFTERRRLAWVLEQSDDGYVMLDADECITYANPQARLYLSVPADAELPGNESFLERVSRYYHCEPSAEWKHWPDLLSSRSPCYLVRPETATARAFWLQIESFTPDPSMPTSRVLRLRNVTEQVTTQRDMRAFHTMISHKLSTPLHQIIACLSLLASDAEKMLVGEIIEFTTAALCSAERLHEAVADILQYASTPPLLIAEAGTQLGDMPALIHEVASKLEILSISTSLAAGIEETYLRLSPQSMAVIFWELLENAQKFHPHHDPTIEITITSTGPGQIRLEVADDGLTLSPEQLTRAWIPYYQGEKLFTGEVHGMGLGLTTVATLVWGIGGTCHLGNRSDRVGVVVELVIPSFV